MRACLSLVVLFAACVVAVPAPAPTQAQQLSKRSFKVELVRNPGFVQRGALSDLPRAYRKVEQMDFSGLRSKHSNTKSGGNPVSTNGTHNEEGSVTATGLAGGVEFVGPVNIGGNQTMFVVFDTGSSDFWVLHTGLNATNINKEQLFNPDESQTFRQENGATFNISYGDGSFASGPVGTDTVGIGNVEVDSLRFGLPNNISNSFTELPSSGILGLAFPGLNTIKPGPPQTFLELALPTLEAPLFTADLRANTNGTYEFGRIDDTKFSGDLSWASVQSESGFWLFPSSSVEISGAGSLRLPGCRAIADTGTTLLILDPRTVEFYFNQANIIDFNQAGNAIVDCNEELPDLSLSIGDVFNAKIPGDVIRFEQEDGSMCLFSFLSPFIKKLKLIKPLHSLHYWHGAHREAR